ncbi:hypothetical protein NC652_024402 [Populus alba x Populus x berolinensis]|nr:hypothetical protein NC652_024402 [Populus alba x Populus x berolinensis]
MTGSLVEGPIVESKDEGPLKRDYDGDSGDVVYYKMVLGDENPKHGINGWQPDTDDIVVVAPARKVGLWFSWLWGKNESCCPVCFSMKREDE